MTEEISTSVVNEEDKELLDKASELVKLFQTAIELGYSITFSPAQLKLLIAICEDGYLVKRPKE